MKSKDISDYKPDPENANRGTERGGYMLEESISKLGLGRSILVDKNGVIIAGNKTHEAAGDRGIIEVIEVETTGNQLVVVKRSDLDLSSDDDRARLLAYADNRTSEVSLDWDPEQLLKDIENDLPISDLFREYEIDELLAEIRTPDFLPSTGLPSSLDQDKKMVTCPVCGHEFSH